MSFVLIADIGGTNARFARVTDQGIVDEKVLKVADYPGPAEAASAYLKQINAGTPRAATFAVAGPVTGADTFTLTNHPWVFSISATRAALGLESFDLINDFHAMALGVLNVDQAKSVQLGGDKPMLHANVGVMGPGTGLGVASLVWDARNNHYVPVPCEGAHATLSIKTDREWALTRWLIANKYHHISIERVCSGKGLVNLYNAICGVDEIANEGLEPEEISARALTGTCKACREAVDLMLAFLGRAAGNLALTVTTRGGVYLCGGILPKLGLDFIEKSALRAEFVSKGRFTDYLEPIPLYIVTDGFLPLKGLRIHAVGDK